MKALILSLAILASVQSFAGSSDIGTGNKNENQVNLLCDARGFELDQNGVIIDFLPGSVFSKEYTVNAGENKKITSVGRHEFYIRNTEGHIIVRILDTKTDIEVSSIDYNNTGAFAVSIDHKKERQVATFNCQILK